jgi:folate-binding protein YgfZ
MNSPVHLDHRAIISVSGADAEAFLQGLLTQTTVNLHAGERRYAALLTPQGKIIADMIVERGTDGFLLECGYGVAGNLAKRLTMFRLRAQVKIEERPDLGVFAFAGTPDPRSPDMPARRYGERVLPGDDLSAYHAARIAAGIAEQGIDLGEGDVFPADINMDLLNGVDFKKGCFVGQEVVSRMKRRGIARRRTLNVKLDADIAAPCPMSADGFEVGEITSVQGRLALARVRIDRVSEALAKGHKLKAGEATVTIDRPDWWAGEIALLDEKGAT